MQKFFFIGVFLLCTIRQSSVVTVAAYSPNFITHTSWSCLYTIENTFQ